MKQLSRKFVKQIGVGGDIDVHYIFRARLDFYQRFRYGTRPMSCSKAHKGICRHFNSNVMITSILEQLDTYGYL